MQVDILGPLRVRVDGQETDLGGPRNRALIARLALDAGRPVRATTLIDDLWGIDVPADAANALQSIVSRTRRKLPPGILTSTPAGYALHVPGGGVDAHEFQRLAAEGHTAKALALWRGAALDDLRDVPFAEPAASRLDELRLGVLEKHLGTIVGNGSDPAVVAELAELTAAHPYREGLWSLYLRALVDTGRAGEALTVYEGMRKTLADDLGTDPSASLREQHLAILRGESAPDRSRRASLPAALTTFVGRAEALDDIEAALGEYRLVTILGPGGAGKTRLAIEAARRIDRAFDDVWLVELAPVTGPEDVLPAILTAMGLLEVAVLERGAKSLRGDERERLVEALREQRGLIILDNCEHLVDTVAQVAEDLLSQAASLTVLATSREPLRIIGELGYQLSSLSTPPPGTEVAVAAEFGAVDLFVQRAHAVDQTFVLAEDSLPSVIEICARLDGQPLAIELAAARLRTLTVAQIASRLSDRFRLLTGGSRTSLPRHRTLRAVVEWSWDLLDEAERQLAERIAVFPAGVTAESAAAVSDAQTADVLDSLAEKSLLVPVRAVTPRFRMLETLREYGIGRLIENGTVQEVRSAHLDYFLGFVERRGPALRGPKQLEIFGELDAERGNITSALRFAVDQGDRGKAGRMVMALAWYWSIRNQHIDATSWAAAVLELPGSGAPEAEICCLGLAITSVFMGGKDVDVTEMVDKILAIHDAHDIDNPVVDVILAVIDFFDAAGDRTFGEPKDIWTRAAINLARIVLLENEGKVEESIELLDPTIELFREVGDRWGLASVISQKALVFAMEGKSDEAIAAWDEALPLLRSLGAEEDVEYTEVKVMTLRLSTADVTGIDELRTEILQRLDNARERGSGRLELVGTMNLGHLEYIAGNVDEAIKHLRHVLDNIESQGSYGTGQLEASILASIAIGEAIRGDQEMAALTLSDAVRVGRKTRDMPIISQVAASAAYLSSTTGEPELAARKLGASEAIRGMPDLMDRAIKVLTENLREDLGDEAFEALFAEGRALDRDAAIDLALGSDAPVLD